AGVVLELPDDLARLDRVGQGLAVLDPDDAGAILVAELDPDRDLEAVAAPGLAVLDPGGEVALLEVEVVGDVVALLVELARASGGDPRQVGAGADPHAAADLVVGQGRDR